MDKRYLKNKMGGIGKLGSNNTTNSGMLPSASKYFSKKVGYQCIHILNNREILNGLKCRNIIQKRESLFKYQARIYNFQKDSGVNNKGMKMRRNNKPFTSLNINKGLIFPCDRQRVLRNYTCCSDTKVGPGALAITIIPCSFHAYTNILSLSWDSKIK